MKLREITECYIHFFINPLNFSSCLEFTVCHYCCHQIKHFRCHQFPFPLRQCHNDAAKLHANSRLICHCFLFSCGCQLAIAVTIALCGNSCCQCHCRCNAALVTPVAVLGIVVFVLPSPLLIAASAFLKCAVVAAPLALLHRR